MRDRHGLEYKFYARSSPVTNSFASYGAYILQSCSTRSENTLFQILYQKKIKTVVRFHHSCSCSLERNHSSMATRPQTAVSGHRIPPGMQPAAGLAKTALIMPPGRKRLSLNGGAETPRPFLSSSFRQDRRVLRAVSRACAASALLRPGAGGMLPPCLAPSFLVHRLPLLRRSGFVERQ